jgi:virulence-associated protein VapD
MHVLLKCRQTSLYLSEDNRCSHEWAGESREIASVMYSFLQSATGIKTLEPNEIMKAETEPDKPAVLAQTHIDIRAQLMLFRFRNIERTGRTY